MKQLTVGSIFSGIGGFDVAARWMGWKTRWMIEINPFCQRVLARHFPGAMIYDDARSTNYRTIESVDVVVGGFPCQGHSGASRYNKGSTYHKRHHDDTFLWRDFARCLRHVRPSYAVVENVPAIIRDGTLPIILADLATLGYDAEWEVISAASVGSPQRRERVWITAYLHSVGTSRHVTRVCARRANQGWQSRKSYLQTFAKAPFSRHGSVPQPLLRRMDDGFQERVDRLNAIGNAVVPQVVYNYPFQIIKQIEMSR